MYWARPNIDGFKIYHDQRGVIGEILNWRKDPGKWNAVPEDHTNRPNKLCDSYIEAYDYLTGEGR